MSGTVLAFILGLIILVVFVLLSMTGYVDALFILLSILTPLTAFLLGALGLRLFGRESEMRHDTFHSVNLWISIGLIMLSLSEIAAILLSFTAGPPQIEATIGLVQMPGLLLWGFGILQYLRSVNSSLEFTETGRLWMSLLIAASLATLAFIAANALYLPWIGAIENVILSPIVVGQGVLATITLGLVWTFRHGEIARPLFLVFCGFLLYLVRTAHWAFTISTIGTPLNSIIAVEAYIFFGAALALARNLGVRIR
jgi:hypothetical protein